MEQEAWHISQCKEETTDGMALRVLSGQDDMAVEDDGTGFEGGVGGALETPR